MNCHRVNRNGKPASWFHSLFCAECRAAQGADELLAFGIVQLRQQSGAHDALNRTLAALNLAAVPSDFQIVRRRRSKRRRRLATVASVAMGMCGWITYINWIPADPHPVAFSQDLRGFDAFKTARKAIVKGPLLEKSLSTQPKRHPMEGSPTLDAAAQEESDAFAKISKDINTLETRQTFDSVPEEEAVGDYVAANEKALAMIHGCMATPYHEPLIRDLHDETYPTSSLYSLTLMLRAAAIWKFSRGDHAGALEEALGLMTIGENATGGGSLNSRLLGVRSVSYGRQILWRLLPKLSAEEARRACREVEALRRLHAPLRTTLNWERESGMAIRRSILSKPLWRWYAARDFTTGGYPLDFAIALHGVSNRKLLNSYSTYMDGIETELSGPYLGIGNMHTAAPTDFIDSMLIPSYSSVQFNDFRCETSNALLTTALALQAYHLENSSYPANLQALCPEYLAQVPTDPFQAGSALHYAPKHKDNVLYNVATRLLQKSAAPSYLLYSVGPDGIDQHGTPATHGNALAPEAKYDTIAVREDSVGDIVVGVNL